MARDTGLRSPFRAVLLFSYIITINALRIERRAGVVPTTLPGKWTSQGCYSDVGRTLTLGGYNSDTAMTDESCISYCTGLGATYAGTEYSSQCYCGLSLASGATPLASSACSMTCTGNSTEACGGPNALNLFWSGATGPSTNPGVGNWSLSGCYAEPKNGRALTFGASPLGGSSVMTVATCTAACKAAGYPLAGVEYSGECYCDNKVQNGAVLSTAGLAGCNMLCKGNSSEYCGGSGTLDVYDYNNVVSLPPYTTVSSTTVMGPMSTPKTTTTSSSKTTSTSTSSSSSSTKTSSSTSSVKTTSSSSTSSTSTSSVSSSKSSSSSVSSSTSTMSSSSTKPTSTTMSTVSSSKSSSSTSSTVPSTSSTSSSSSSTSSSSSSASSSASSSTSTVKPTTSSSTSSTVTSSSSTRSSSVVSTTSPISSTSASSTSSSSSALVGTTSSSSTSSVVSSSSSISSTGSSSSSSTSSAVSSTSSSISSTVSSTSSSAPSSTSSTSSAVSSTSSASSSTVSSTSSSAPTSTSITTSSSSSSSMVTSTSSSAAPMKSLAIVPKIGNYNFQGCWTEATGMRALSGAAYFDGVAMTLEECANSCAGWKYWGVEYGQECYCGNSLNPGSVQDDISQCSFTCPGNRYEYCGAGNHLELYLLNGTSIPTSSAAGTSTATSSSTSASAPSVTAVSAPSGWAYQGCYAEPAGGRMLMNQQPDNSKTLTHESCMALCASQGYTIAGMEYQVQCFCDSHIYNGASLAANQADCNNPCPGNATEICGAGGRMNLFSKGTPQVYLPPTAQTTGLPDNWMYVGCLQDNIASKETDPNGNTVTVTTFPYMAYQDANNTAVRCIETCAAYGYNAAGTEYGTQCFCGDVENIYVASDPSAQAKMSVAQNYTRSAIPTIVSDSQCNSYCSGDPTHFCGSGNLMNYYTWNGSAPMYNWNFPTGNAAGQYSQLIGGLIVPLMTTQAINGKVLLIEKYGSGEPNGTGAYELDMSLTNDYKHAWREMDGMQTDVFCSAGLMLPDKAGRILTVGGWAGESNFGVRMYSPDGSAGVNGTNQWAEDPGVLSLQVPRWYPSALGMANGSIMIIGGEIGSNDAEQPTLELLPATGVPDSTTISGYSNTTKYLDFLDRTAPFNLYPFVCVVPSGIFIAYFNEARILDDVNFNTIKTLPNMPAAVNDPTGGRTYQLEGAMVLLPQYAPYTENLGVLICGGSTSNGGYSLDNCISTRPEDANPTWTIERMPSRRVMPCMAGLPDGTYLILNGAQHGVAGFGLGDNPNYNAVLYDPSKPINSRMSVMANTTVARLYHSEAIVLLDGRVIVTGSDPSGNYNAAEVTSEDGWPEEYRVEVFTPPYLMGNPARPAFSIPVTDWAYGESYTFTMTAGQASKVSLLGAVVSTHGNAMGQRTIIPAFSCNGNTCTVEAPPDAFRAPPGWFMFFVMDGPTPSVGVYVRIGGDPAELGNWPKNIPNFELPGM